MRIAYDHKIFWSQKYGGISRYFTNLFIQLNKRNIDHKIFSSFYKNEYLNKINKDFIYGQYLKFIPKYTSFIFKNINEITTPIKIKKWNPDIVHYTYYYDKLKKIDKPIVLTVYDLFHEKNSYAQNKPILPKKNTIDVADKIICISKETKKDLINYYGVNEKKISVIYLGGNHFNLLNHSNKLSHNFTKKPYILFVGSRAKYKNFKFLIEAFGASKKLSKEFDIISFGGEKLSKEEKGFILSNNMSLESVTQIFGDDELLKNLYKNAELFIFPSLNEGFGIPIIESWINKCPVLCSNIPIFKEICDDAVEYFDPKNKFSLIDKLETILINSSKKIELKNKGYHRSKKFSWEKCAEDTISLYKEVL